MTGSSVKRNNSQVIVQAGILAAASIVVRIIGLLYQAPLTAIIGDEGNGYYSFAYNIYTIVLLISSYSIPSAVSKLMAQKLALRYYRDAQRIFHVVLAYVLCVGGFLSVFIYFTAGFFVGSSSVPVLRVFTPTIFLFGLLGALRGYFQAQATMVPTSISQVIEQIMNAAMSILAAWLFIRSAGGADPTEQAIRGAQGSALGTGIGVVSALLFMTWVYYLNGDRRKKRIEKDKSGVETPYREILFEVMRVVTPFVLSSFILNLTTTLNQTIYSRIMMDVRALDQAFVTTQYGIFSRKATVITNIPISVATAASAAVIPDISAAFAFGDREKTLFRARSAVHITSLLAIPCAAGLFFLAKPVTMLLFPQKASLDQASYLLMALAVSVFFYSISTVTNAVLQSTEHMNLPLVSAVIALVMQTVLLQILLRKTDLDVYALVISSVAYSVMIFLANEFFLRRYLGSSANLGHDYVVPVVSSVLMGCASFLAYKLINWILISAAGMGKTLKGEYFANLIAIIPAIAGAVVIYAFLLIRLKAVTREDLLGMPRGAKLVKMAERLRFFPGSR